MAEKEKFEVKLSNGYSSISAAIIVLFFMLWAQSGWYRIDCALGVKKACEMIEAEKEYRTGGGK